MCPKPSGLGLERRHLFQRSARCPTTSLFVTTWADRIHRCRSFWERRILIETFPPYLRFRSRLTAKWQFPRRTGFSRPNCDLLLDINNVFVNASITLTPDRSISLPCQSIASKAIHFWLATSSKVLSFDYRTKRCNPCLVAVSRKP